MYQLFSAVETRDLQKKLNVLIGQAGVAFCVSAGRFTCLSTCECINPFNNTLLYQLNNAKCFFRHKQVKT